MFNRHILENISKEYHKDVKTIHKYFAIYEDRLSFPDLSKDGKINLMFDATYFGRDYGWLVFRTNSKNIHAKKIKTERIDIILEELKHLESKGYAFKSITTDGGARVCDILKRHYPFLPIQFCQFHQKMITRRYLTLNPKLECGKELKSLTDKLTKMNDKSFKKELEDLQKKYKDFLLERNENGEFMHKKLRSAFRSLRTNLPYLFTYKNFPNLNIPNTTGSSESNFSHWKSKVKIHRGLREDRKDKMILYLIKIS